MGQVILDLKEYDELKKQANLVEQTKDCFLLEKSYDGEIKLNISVGKAAEIFKALFSESYYNDGTYKIEVDKDLDYYTTDVAGYYVKAIKKEEPKEDEEVKEDEE